MSDFRISQLSSQQGSVRLLDNHLSPQILPLKPSPNFDGDLIANAVSMNFSGRFSGQEVKDVGYSVIKHIVTSKTVSLFFGQQSTFRLTALPDNFELIGSQRTFVLYNKTLFHANDENQYKHFLRDLEMRGRLPKYYLPEANYTMCKMKCKVMPDMAFIVMSWVTDEGKEVLKCLNLLRKLLSFTANLCAIEEMPILIAGSFRLPLEQVKEVVYNEFEGFRCYGYKTTKPRRAQRMCDMFISCPPLKLEEVKPLVCGKIEVVSNNKTLVAERSRNPEDAFYWDPVFAHILRRSGTSSMMSPTSPRALSPPSLDGSDGENDEHDPQPTIEPWRSQAASAAAALTSLHSSSSGIPVTATRSRPQPPPFETAEDTLRALLLESERIKQLVSDAETKARSRLSNRPTQASDEGKTSRESSSHRPPTGSAEKPLEKSHVESLNGNKLDEDAEFRRLEKAINTGERVVEGGGGDEASRKAKDATAVAKGGMQTLAPVKIPSSPLRKTPSYIDLYDEELVETNRLCYMQ